MSLCDNTQSIEQCHANRGFKIFAVVVPKDGLSGTCPARSSLGMTSTIELYSVVFTDYIL